MFYEIEGSPITIIVDFDYTSGDPHSVVVLKHVWVGSSNGRIDILSNIDTRDKMSLQEGCLEYAQENNY